MIITFVQFQRPVTFASIGTEFWSRSDMKFKDITCEDKQNHLLFTTTIQGRTRVVKVPLTNIAQVTLEDAPKDKP